MTGLVTPDAVAIRFAPTGHTNVEARAEREFRESGHYRLSVFVDTRHEDEPPEEVFSRLLRAADMFAATNAKYFVCPRVEVPLGLGFKFEKDDYPDEPTEHYSVNIEPDSGQLKRPLSVCRFLAAFTSTRKMP